MNCHVTYKDGPSPGALLGEGPSFRNKCGAVPSLNCNVWRGKGTLDALKKLRLMVFYHSRDIFEAGSSYKNSSAIETVWKFTAGLITHFISSSF